MPTGSTRDAGWVQWRAPAAPLGGLGGCITASCPCPCPCPWLGAFSQIRGAPDGRLTLVGVCPACPGGGARPQRLSSALAGPTRQGGRGCQSEKTGSRSAGTVRETPCTEQGPVLGSSGPPTVKRGHDTLEGLSQSRSQCQRCPQEGSPLRIRWLCFPAPIQRRDPKGQPKVSFFPKKGPLSWSPDLGLPAC